MKLKAMLFLLMLSPAVSLCQSIDFPSVGGVENPETSITNIDVSGDNTVITFKRISAHKGEVVQLNKSIYLQDADGDERFDYIKSEGIPVRPEKLITDKDSSEIIYKVYFEKLYSSTKTINVIDRARTAPLTPGGPLYNNFYTVSLEKSGPAIPLEVKALPPGVPTVPVVPAVSKVPVVPVVPAVSVVKDSVAAVPAAPMDPQLKFYSNPATTTQLAIITKNYYDALIKAGFSAEMAFKIATSKQFVDPTK